MKSKSKRRLIIKVFSGFHDPSLTVQFIQQIQDGLNKNLLEDTLISFESNSMVMNSWSFNREESLDGEGNEKTSTLLIGFSAGVINAAIAANIMVNQQSNPVALIAIDGWGVPLFSKAFPVFRFSHDLFTHSSSTILGGQGIFVADPPSSHLELWKSPSQVKGWFISPDEKNPAMAMNADQAIVEIISHLMKGEA